MNRRDFYKELMRDYTFDSAKVRRHAKLSCIATGSKSLRKTAKTNKRLWQIPLTAAAAVLALTLGLQVALSDLFIGGTPTVKEFDVSDARGRIANSERDLAQMAGLNFGTRTLFLSFNDSITFTTMQNALDSVSDTGNIVLEAVYTLSEKNAVSVVSGVHLQALQGGEAENIVGAKVYAPVMLISDLSKQSEVALVEVSTEQLNENNFVPLAVVGFEREREPSELNIETPTTPPTSESVSVETFVNFNLTGVTHAEFTDDYHFTAITADAVALYEIYHDDESEAMKVRAVAQHDIDGELVFTFFDEARCRKIMRIRNDTSNAIFVIDGVDGRNFEVSKVIVFPADTRLSVLALTEDTLYYSVERKKVFAYDLSEGKSREVLSFDSAVSFERNSGLTCFAINPGNSGSSGEQAQMYSQVYDVAREKLIVADTQTESLLFYRNSTNVLTDGENYFTTSLELIDDLSEYEIKFASRRNMSSLFEVFEITEQGIRILVN